MSDEYVKVRVILIARTKNALLIDAAPISSSEVDKQWVPLSVIHSADEARIGNNHSTDVVSFRMRAWKAKELGLD